MDWSGGLLLALRRHCGTNLFNKPVLKFLARLQSATTDNERVGVKRVHHLVEEKTQGMGLHSENFYAQRIALVRQTAHEFSRLMQIEFGQLVTRVTRQKIWQNILLDRG